MHDIEKFGFTLPASSEEERKLLLEIQELGWIYGFIPIDEFLAMKEPPHPHKSDARNKAKFERLQNKCRKFKEDEKAQSLTDIENKETKQ
jgi:hypothetical protein